jgi:hypothetical protein
VCSALGHCGEPASGDWGVTCTTSAECSGGLACLSMIPGLPIYSMCTTTCVDGSECPADWICMPPLMGSGDSICSNLGGTPLP